MRTKTYTTDAFLKALYKAAEFKGGLDKLIEPMVITDEDGVILFANDAVTQRTGFTVEEVIGKTPGELWGNQKDKSYYQDMWQTIKIEKKPFTATLTNRRKDGTYYGCELRIYPVLDESKNVTYFLGIESDYTDAV